VDLHTHFLPEDLVTPGRRFFVVVASRGRVRWSQKVGERDEHLLVLVSELTPSSYLAFLRDEAIPYLVAGTDRVDLPRALELLRTRLGVATVVASGGGLLNGGLLRAGLVDEVDIDFLPAIIGGGGAPTLFDGAPLGPEETPARLTPIVVQQKPNGGIFVRYEVLYVDQVWPDASVRGSCSVLVVEEPDPDEGHRHPVVVRRGDHLDVPQRAAGLRHELDTAARCSVDRVSKRNHAVGRHRDPSQLRDPVRSLGLWESSRAGCQHRQRGLAHGIATGERVDRVVTIRATRPIVERKGGEDGMLPQPPQLGLLGGEPCASDPRLLTGADAEDLPVAGEADRVRLRVLGGHRGHREVTHRLIRKPTDRYDIRERARVDAELITLLFEPHAEHVPAFHLRRLVPGVHLEDHEGSALLPSQELDYSGFEPRRDDAVRDLDRQQLRRSKIDRLAQRPQSPYEDRRSVPRARAYAAASGVSSSSSTRQDRWSSGGSGNPMAAPDGLTCLNEAAAGS
jgi:riboflavin biosynthesis pyrimidine reductase